MSGSESDTLASGDHLRPGDSRVSANGKYRFVYQEDGNLVLYGPVKFLWDAACAGKEVGACLMTVSGSLDIKNALDVSIWTSGGHSPGARLVVQDDGNVVVYGLDGEVVWATGTEQLVQVSQSKQELSDPELPPIEIIGPETVVAGFPPTELLLPSAASVPSLRPPPVGQQMIAETKVKDGLRKAAKRADSLLQVQNQPACLDAESNKTLERMHDRIQAYASLAKFLRVTDLALIFLPRSPGSKLTRSELTNLLLLTPVPLKHELSTAAGLEFARAAGNGDSCQEKYWRAVFEAFAA